LEKNRKDEKKKKKRFKPSKTGLAILSPKDIFKRGKTISRGGEKLDRIHSQTKITTCTHQKDNTGEGGY